jgi:hypothetical protein
VLPPLPALPPPSKSTLGAPTIEQGVLVVLDGGGLRPGVASSVAPIGMPTGGTADPGPMPSGDVIPSGGGAAPTWANAVPQPRMSRRAAGIVILISFTCSLSCRGEIRARPSAQFTPSCGDSLSE